MLLFILLLLVPLLRVFGCFVCFFICSTFVSLSLLTLSFATSFYWISHCRHIIWHLWLFIIQLTMKWLCHNSFIFINWTTQIFTLKKEQTYRHIQAFASPLWSSMNTIELKILELNRITSNRHGSSWIYSTVYKSVACWNANTKKATQTDYRIISIRLSFICVA